MQVYAIMIGLVCISACIGVILGKQAACVFVTNTRTIKIIAGITGVGGVIVALIWAYILGWLR